MSRSPGKDRTESQSADKTTVTGEHHADCQQKGFVARLGSAWCWSLQGTGSCVRIPFWGLPGQRGGCSAVGVWGRGCKAQVTRPQRIHPVILLFTFPAKECQTKTLKSYP